MRKMTKYFRNTLMIAIFILAISASGALAATFTVTNTSDSGAGSLRDALTQANQNAQDDTINFAAGVFGTVQTITLTTGDLPISRDSATTTGRLLIINGPGANLLTISGGNASRIFYVTQNSNVVMSGMTLSDGNATGTVTSANNDGGAIYATTSAILSLSAMTIRNNSAVNSGGAIYALQSSLTMSNMTIRNNSAKNGGGVYSTSGKLFNLTNSLVTENTASVSYGGIYAYSVTGNLTTTFTNTIISNNTAVNSVGGAEISGSVFTIANCQITGNHGGYTGGLSLNLTTGTVTDTIVSNNNAETSSYGGVYARGDDGIVFRRVTISGNIAHPGSGGGGGIAMNGNNVTLIDSLVANNTIIPTGGQVTSGGGVIVGSNNAFIINTTITGNTAGFGGGVYNTSTNLKIINSTITGNSATNTSGSDCNYGLGGGGLVARISNTQTYFQNTIIAGNTTASACGPDVQGTVTSNGYNIIGNTTGATGFGAAGDQLNVNPLLGNLANNGGATQTIALQAGSPAINAGNNALAVDQNGIPLRFDQRGACFRRIIGGTVDIGAYEVGVSAPCAATPFDFDGDGRSDLSVFRPSTGAWYLNQSSAGFTGVSFGISTDLIAPADFDGDGKTDIAVFRPSTGTWYYLRSSDNSFVGVQFGSNGDLPRPGDFDGDGKADINVFRPSNGTWYRLNSSTGAFVGAAFGQNGDHPLVADFDGDGKNDLAVFRPSVSIFYWLDSSTGAFHGAAFGAGGDIPTAGDFDGDGKTDIAVFRPSNGTWYRYNSSTGAFVAINFGLSGDIPVPADYDGDGKTDIAVFRNGTWYYLNSSNGAFTGVGFGFGTDQPIPAAF